MSLSIFVSVIAYEERKKGGLVVATYGLMKSLKMNLNLK